MIFNQINLCKQFDKTFTGKLPSCEVVFKKEVCLDVVRYLKPFLRFDTLYD